MEHFVNLFGWYWDYSVLLYIGLGARCSHSCWNCGNWALPPLLPDHLLCTNVLLSNFSLVQIFFSPNFLLSNFSLVQIFFCPNFLLSKFSLVRIFVCPNFILSNFSCVAKVFQFSALHSYPCSGILLHISNFVGAHSSHSCWRCGHWALPTLLPSHLFCPNFLLI